jgi:hypothetical protein
MIKNDYIYRLRRQRNRVPCSQDEPDMLAKPASCVLKPRLVYIEPDDISPGKPKLFRNEASRTPDVQHLQATQVLPSKKVPENSQDLGGLAPASLLVEDLSLKFGIPQLHGLELSGVRLVPWRALLTDQLSSYSAGIA